MWPMRPWASWTISSWGSGRAEESQGGRASEGIPPVSEFSCRESWAMETSWSEERLGRDEGRGAGLFLVAGWEAGVRPSRKSFMVDYCAAGDAPAAGVGEGVGFCARVRLTVMRLLSSESTEIFGSGSESP